MPFSSHSWRDVFDGLKSVTLNWMPVSGWIWLWLTLGGAVGALGGTGFGVPLARSTSVGAGPLLCLLNKSYL